MQALLNKATKINDLNRSYSIQSRTRKVIMIVPIVVIILCLILIANPSTRGMSLWMLKENHPIEVLTAAIFAISGVIGLKLARNARRCGEESFVYCFYTIFSIGLLFIAMEEIAWGQWLFGFETPKAWEAINQQGETTIHNIYGLSGHSEIWRLIIGVGGISGIWLSVYPPFQKIGVPAILFPWFIIISAHAFIDVYNDFIPIQKQFDDYVMRTDEDISDRASRVPVEKVIV